MYFEFLALRTALILNINRSSISCFSDIENPHSKALSLKYLGELLRKKGDTYEAEIMHRKAIAIYNYYFMTYELTDSWISLGLIEESRADYGEAHKCYKMSLSYAIDTENREAELAARRYLSNMGNVLLAGFFLRKVPSFVKLCCPDQIDHTAQFRCPFTMLPADNFSFFS